jgi:hypothetical protein
MIAIAAITTVFAALFAGCGDSLQEFTFTYSSESAGSYKTSVSFDSRQAYRIEIYNYYMDNHAGKHRPIVKEGTLTDEEYKTLKKLLSKCNLFKMDDAYGFGRENDEFAGDIMHQMHFQTPQKNKFISIRHITEHTYPLSFVNLWVYANTFLSEHK